jgi:hypothetical protein
MPGTKEISSGNIASQKRYTIKQIDSSYNNDWDVLAELSQNSVDAIIRKGRTENNTIEIVLNADDKSILWKDNGSGFNIEKLTGDETLLDVFMTDKEGNFNEVGEKGVGLKFIMYKTDLFEIETFDGNQGTIVKVTGASTWKNGNSPDLLKFDYDDFNQAYSGTTISLQKINNSIDRIFQLSIVQLEHILRTKTALGRTLKIWLNEDLEITVNLTLIRNGQDEHSTFKVGYDLIEDRITSFEDFDEFVKWTKSADRTDQQKKNKLRNKAIRKKGFVQDPYTQREIRYYMIFMPQREIFTDISVHQNICSAENLESDEWNENFGYCQFTSGIYISTKGMPTGIKIPEPRTGYQGYWPNIFMIIEDSDLVFDIGRKYIDGRKTRKISEIAKKEFNQVINIVAKYISGSPSGGISAQFDKVATYQEIQTLPDLGSSKLKFVKTPAEQEASVCAIFFELIGLGAIKDVNPVISGYKNVYDLYATININGTHRFVIIEFKSKLRNVIEDFRNNIKYANDIDCIVCWGVSDIDIDKIETAQGWSVDSGDYSNEFPYATHKVNIDGARNFWVIDLEQLIRNIPEN